MKTGGFDPFQIKLFQVAKSLEKEGELCFRVPAIIKQGEQKGRPWVLFENIEGKPLNDFFDEDPNGCVDWSFRISQDYQQKVIEKMQTTQSLGDILEYGEEWLFSRLILWSKPLIDAKLVSFAEIKKLQEDLKKKIAEKGEFFFEISHGNVIGDHVIFSGKTPYLLDLNAVPRIGRGYHDFIRAIDFMILMVESTKDLEKLIPVWVSKYLSGFDLDEIRLVFSFRMIGIFWDIISGKSDDYRRGEDKEKIDLALKLFRRELF